MPASGGPVVVSSANLVADGGSQSTADSSRISDRVSPWRRLVESRWASQIVSALSLSVLALWWLGFYPAISTVDSGQSWDQAKAWVFQDWHPVFYTWLMALLIRVWETPAIITGTQILCLSLILGSLHRRFRRVGLSPSLAFVAPILVAMSPQTGLTSMAMWKDIPFAIAVLWMFTEVLDVAADPARYLGSWWRVARLASALSMVILLRHNGKLLVAGVVLALVVAHWRWWPQVLVAASITLMSYALVTGPLYTYLRAWKSPVMFSYTMFIHDMAAVVNEHEAELEPADREFLNSILPINRWQAKTVSNPDGLYFCRQATPLIFPPEFYPKERLDAAGNVVASSKLHPVLRQNSESVFLEQHRAEFRDLWVRSAKKWPGTILGHRACVGSLAWSPWHQTGFEVFQAPFKSGVANPDLQVAPKSKAVQSFLKTVLRRWDRNGLRWITWRAVTVTYLGFAIVVLCALRRREWRFMLVAASGFAAWFSVLTFTPGQSARYMFPAYLCALATLPLVTLIWKKQSALMVPSAIVLDHGSAPLPSGHAVGAGVALADAGVTAALDADSAVSQVTAEASGAEAPRGDAPDSLG